MLHTIIKILIIAMLALFAYAGYTTISEAEAAMFADTFTLAFTGMLPLSSL
jgi:Tfp pilus assembly protein PilE